MVDTCELGLIEAARIVNILRERRITSPSITSLIVWSEATASRSIHRPAPALGLDLLRTLDLVAENSDGTANPNALLAPSSASPCAELERFPNDLFALVLDRLMRVTDLRAELCRILPFCMVTRERGLVVWKHVPREARKHPAWLWIQRIGSAVQSEIGLTLDKALIPYILDIREARVPLSQEELDMRLALQKERATLAEEFIVQLERARLRVQGADYLAEAVARISIEDVNAGYDVQSFEVTGRPRLIEVKSCAGARDRFVLSENERAVAEANGDAYWLAWLSFAANLPSGPVDVCWVQNLSKALLSHPSPWRLSTSGATIDLVGDDTQLLTTP